MSTPTISMLAGLVQGYTKAKDDVLHEKTEGLKQQRDMMVQYLGHLATNPNIPPEHQQWALNKVKELVEADPSKKLPKVDLAELPPVSVQQPPRQTSPTLPGMTLKAPVGPGGASTPATASATPPGASGDVGRASNGTVNAIGAVQPPVRPAGYTGEMPLTSVRMGDEPMPGAVATGTTDAQGRPMLQPNGPNFQVAPPAPLTLPAQPQPTVVNPTPPIPISSGGLHVLTPQDREAYAKAAGAVKDKYTLTPGEARYEDGREVARNTAEKPGQKSGYEPKMGPGGPIGVTDVSTGGMLTPEQVKANPQAKAVLEQAQAEHEKQQNEQEARDTRKIEAAANAAAKAQEASQHRQVTAAATDAAKKAKPMVDLLDTQTQYMNGLANGEEPTPRKDLALIVAAVRAMNPGTVRLPQKELELELHAGSYGDRFRRWFDTATEGTLPSDQRLDLFRIVHDETTKTASSAAENWKDAFAGSRDEEPPSYLRRFLETEAPEGASHEVLDQSGNVIGHVIEENGRKKFKPLK